MARGSFVRISSLLWADILVGYAFFTMQNYLTDVWGLSFTNSAAIMNFYGGLCLILPVFFLFLVDEFLGHFTMLVLSSLSYSLGIAFIAMSTPPVLANSTGMCKQYEPNCVGHIQRVLFYIGMVLVAVGVSGNQVSLKPFLEKQGYKSDETFQLIDRVQSTGFLIVGVVAIVGAIALPYIKPWSIRFGIPAICTVIATCLFLSGSCSYVKKDSKGSPLNDVPHGRQEQESFRPTRVCTVREVEDAKIAIRMIPMWLTLIVCGIISSVGSSYFVEQSNNMNRRIGKWNLPPQILFLFYRSSRDSLDALALRFLSEKKATATKTATTPAVKTACDGIKSAIGIGIAMVLSVLCCITSAKIELKRLNVIRNHGLLDKPDDDIPMSVYWLLFQFFLLAGLDSFFEKSVGQFHECQCPSSMKYYPEYFTKFVFGLGYMFSVLTVYIVGQVSQRVGGRNWFQHTLSRSRVDRYFWVLAALAAVNYVLFIVVASLYRYPKLEASGPGKAVIQGVQVDAGDTGGGGNDQDASNRSGDGNDGGGP